VDLDSKIAVLGSTGLVGSTLTKKLNEEGYTNLVTVSHEKLDLRNQTSVKWFMRDEKPEYVFNCAALVGGIGANSNYPVNFLYDNMMIGFNVIRSCYEVEVKKLMVLGSSCIYPKICKQPIKESSLLSGSLEKSNEGYALAKISTIKLAQACNKQLDTNFISVMPCSLFGCGESFDLENSHLIPAIMRKMHEAKVQGKSEVEIWGSGNPKREFMYIDDLADALLFLMQEYNDSEVINVGTGVELTISEIALMIKEVVEFEGALVYNTNKPDGTMRKLLDSTNLIEMGWKPKVDFKDGLSLLYKWYLKELEENAGETSE
jgi:GDP-L-fucose synthase